MKKYFKLVKGASYSVRARRGKMERVLNGQVIEISAARGFLPADVQAFDKKEQFRECDVQGSLLNPDAPMPDEKPKAEPKSYRKIRRARPHPSQLAKKQLPAPPVESLVSTSKAPAAAVPEKKIAKPEAPPAAATKDSKAVTPVVKVTPTAK